MAVVVVYRPTQSVAPMPEPDQSQSVVVTRPAMRPKGLGPRLPAPRMAAPQTGSEAPVEAIGATNLAARLLNSQQPSNLTIEQVEPYLQRSQRSAESLLAAFRLTGHAEFLREAAEKYSKDPRVALAALHQSRSAEERRQWLDVLKQSDPDNAMARYLSALQYFKSGQSDQAVLELMAASSQTNWRDYVLDSIQSSEEAYLSAGYSIAEAKALAVSGLALPGLGELRDLSRRMVDLAGLYRQAGDAASAQAVLQMGLVLGQRAGQESGRASLIQDLVGLAIERQMLGSMDPASPLDAERQTVQSRLDELARRREAIKELGKQSDAVMKSMSDTDLVIYYDRLKMHGEESALRWALSRQPPP